jgi:hypothetical protein
MKTALLALAGVLIAAPAAATAECREVGRLESVKATFNSPVLIADGHVRHPDGSRSALKELSTRLCAGDQIVVAAPGLTVGYSLVGREDLEWVSREASPARVPDVPSPTPAQCTLPACQRVARLRGAVRYQVHRFAAKTDVRGPLTSMYIPSVAQFLPWDAPVAAVVWQGGSAEVRVDGRAKPATVLFDLIDVPRKSAFDLSVGAEFDPGALTWRVERVRPAPPGPPGFGANGPPSDEDRVERDLWLLEDGAGRAPWRLYAISDIAVLKDRCLVADLAWREIVNGQYSADSAVSPGP